MEAQRQFGGLGAVAAASVLAAKTVNSKIQDVKRAFDYDKGDPDLEYKEGDSWWERRKKDAKRLMRKAQVLTTIRDLRKIETDGVNYGAVRDFWIDSGALDLFNNSTIMGTAGAAIPLIDFFIKKGLLPAAPNVDKANRIHDLMHWFFTRAKIKGYDWNQVAGDEASQAGFA